MDINILLNLILDWEGDIFDLVEHIEAKRLVDGKKYFCKYH